MTRTTAARQAALEADYDADIHAWSLEQASLLRAGRFDAIDIENIAEEILDVGKNEYDKLESALTVLLMHMLKWDTQPERRSRSWAATIAEQRNRALRQLRKNPSLKSRLDEALGDAYEDGRIRASGEMDVDVDRLPATCPYDWDAIVSRPFKRAGNS